MEKENPIITLVEKEIKWLDSEMDKCTNNHIFHQKEANNAKRLFEQYLLQKTFYQEWIKNQLKENKTDA